MKLISPTLDYKDQFLEALAALRTEDTHGFWDYCMDPTDVEGYLHMTARHAQGQDLQEGWVPASTFWLIDNGKWVGHCNIRHKLTTVLEQRGGHIGYAIHPAERRKGYGREILRLALKEARKLSIDRAMVTCESDNDASRKIIESNGGVLDDEYEFEGERVRRYWV